MKTMMKRIDSALRDWTTDGGNHPISEKLGDTGLMEDYLDRTINSIKTEDLVRLRQLALRVPEDTEINGLAVLRESVERIEAKLARRGWIEEEEGEKRCHLPGYPGELSVYPIRYETER